MINLPNGFYAIINESGTHIHKGFLKVRVDIYSPVGSKTYPLHYVDKLDREPTEEELANQALYDLLPTHKELNPCLCHFIKIGFETSKNELKDIILEIFDEPCLVNLDNALVSDSSQVHTIMRNKNGKGSILKGKPDIAIINARFRE